MRWRAAVTGVVAAVLLLCPPVALRCQLVCALERLQPPCHSGAAVGRMAAMPGMGHDEPEPAAGAMRSAVLMAASPCGHAACATQLAPTVGPGAVVVVAPLAPAVAASGFAVARFALDRVSAPQVDRGPPAGEARTPISLHTLLRI